LIEHSKIKNIDKLPIAQRLLESPAKSMNSLQWKVQYPSKAVVHNYGVGFCSQQYAGPAFLSKSHAHLSLLLELLQQEYLHPQIREQNGAYGTGARIR
jgi:Zn-dependent M16 (insulinase) family peptidase